MLCEPSGLKFDEPVKVTLHTNYAKRKGIQRKTVGIKVCFHISKDDIREIYYVDFTFWVLCPLTHQN